MFRGDAVILYPITLNTVRQTFMYNEKLQLFMQENKKGTKYQIHHTCDGPA